MKSVAVDAYIAAFPPAVRMRLKRVRGTIRAAAPNAAEIISYRIPAYKMNRVLVFFAGFKQHIGLFPPVRGDARLEKAVAKYAGPKGNLKFPHDKPLPLALITRIVRLKVRLDKTKVAGELRQK
ncbi:MAG: DUF1801 domain-containing protein [Pseudomonadota bacterium]